MTLAFIVVLIALAVFIVSRQSVVVDCLPTPEWSTC